MSSQIRALPGPPTMPEDANRIVIRRLVWAYFFLLMFEGVLRKWLLPGLSNPLMLVRDPFLLTIYAIALSNGLFIFNGYVSVLSILGAIAVLLGISVGTQDIVVTAFGFDACFLHLPLIFIIPKVMNRDHVLRLGRWALYFTIPMAALMIWQFRSSPDAWINCGTGGGTGSQIRAAMGKIRPPGFFTFITGAAQFLAFATVFLLYGLLKKGVYQKWLLIVCGIAVVLSVGVSSSRLALGSIGFVLLMIGFIVFYDRSSFTGVLQMLLPVGLMFVVATNLDVFKEGQEVFEARLLEAGDAKVGVAGKASNWTQRVLGDYYSWYSSIQQAPFFGRGLGMGTNVGARLLATTNDFQGIESEPSRIVIEMGPVLGSAYIITRLMMCGMLFLVAARAAKIGNFLPMLFFGDCVLLMSTGQFSQPTTLGFAVLGAGLCLAAANLPIRGDLPRPARADASKSVLAKRRSRSPYAEALHRDRSVAQLKNDQPR